MEITALRRDRRHAAGAHAARPFAFQAGLLGISWKASWCYVGCVSDKIDNFYHFGMFHNCDISGFAGPLLCELLGGFEGFEASRVLSACHLRAELADSDTTF